MVVGKHDFNLPEW